MNILAENESEVKGGAFRQVLIDGKEPVERTWRTVYAVQNGREVEVGRWLSTSAENAIYEAKRDLEILPAFSEMTEFRAAESVTHSDTLRKVALATRMAKATDAFGDDEAEFDIPTISQEQAKRNAAYDARRLAQRGTIPAHELTAAMLHSGA